MRKNTLMSFVFLGLLATSCDSSAPVVEDFYSIDTTLIPVECLVGQDVLLDVRFLNLGEPETPDYGVEITFGEEDITESSYNSQTRIFVAEEDGSYDIRFIVLDDEGEALVTPSGASFSKKITLQAVVQSFEAINSAGPDVSINTGVTPTTISFGDSYLGDTKVDSGQYRLTGLSFVGDYFITYRLEDVQYAPNFTDPALYFGWTRNDTNSYDDSIKLSTGAGTMAAWIWGGDGLADLSVNANHGWFYNVWYNAPSSVSDNANISGDHFITFTRYVDEMNNVAIYGISFDDVAFTYLNIDDNYTDVLKNVWVESVNTKLAISVHEFGQPEPLETPHMTLSYSEGEVGETIDLLGGATIADDNIFSSIIVPDFIVTDPDGNEVFIENNLFVPAIEGEYAIEATLTDIANNTIVVNGSINVTQPAAQDIEIDLSKTASMVRVNRAIIIYYEVTELGFPVNGATLRIKKGETLELATDVSDAVLTKHTATTAEEMEFDVFEATESANYWLEVTYEDVVEIKKIIANNTVNSVYGWTYFDTNFDGVALGDGEIIFAGISGGINTGKVGKSITRATNWEISFDVTDLSYSAQGKLGITIGTGRADGSWGGWEDLTLGGNVNNDLWGYEANVLGTGWVSYQWRSTWQAPVTTAFMPNPEDFTLGCGRQGSEYSQYGFGTHSYRITAETDNDGNVTYRYYIDEQLDVIHHTEDAHDFINSTDFFQFWAGSMNGIITNIQVQ